MSPIGEGVILFQAFAQELRFAIRSLARSPGFFAACVFTLALGTGANTAIFSIVNSVLLRPLPYQDASRLAMLNMVWQTRTGMEQGHVSPRVYLEWMRQSHSFDSLAALFATTVTFTEGPDPEMVGEGRVSASFLKTFGVAPQIGRDFRPGEDQPGAPPLVILGNDFWRKKFGSSSSVLGRSINVDGENRTVIGVLPAGFQILSLELDVWVPLTLNAGGGPAAGLDMSTLRVTGRLRKGVTPNQAASDVQAVAQRVAAEFPKFYRGSGATATPLRDVVVGDFRTPLLILLGAVGFVLLIACANVANLLLARMLKRSRQAAIQAALGAGARRLMLSALSESLVIGMTGGLFGLALAYGGIRLLRFLNPENLPRLDEIAIDGRVLLFTFALAMLTSLLFGIYPARQIVRTDLNLVLRDAGRSAINSASGSRFRSALIVSEVALSLVLLIGAGLLLRSLEKLQSLNRGFLPDHLLTMRMSFSKGRYPDRAKIAAFYRDVLRQLHAAPGVSFAALSTALPLDNNRHLGMSFSVEGAPAQESAERASAYCHLISPDYFKATGIPLIEGRAFNDHDDEAASGVIVVTRSLARQYFPGTSPIGKRLVVGIPAVAKSQIPREIVGVVGDVEYPTKKPASSAEIYMPYLQGLWPFVYVVVRTNQDPKLLMQAIRNEVRVVDRGQPVDSIQPMPERIALLNERPQFNSVLAAIFAGIALILAAIGIYGVISYSTGQRTQEIGVRMALGASPRDVTGLVLGQSMLLVGLGLVLGLAVYVALSRLIVSLLYATSSLDVWTIAATTLLLLVITVVASYLPARRALEVDPAKALRAD